MKIDYIDNWLHGYCWTKQRTSLIARFMGPTWGLSGADRTKVGPMLGPWTWLLGIVLQFDLHWVFFIDMKIWPVFIEASTALYVWVMTMPNRETSQKSLGLADQSNCLFHLTDIRWPKWWRFQTEWHGQGCHIFFINYYKYSTPITT